MTKRIVFRVRSAVILVGITAQERSDVDRGGDVLVHGIRRLGGGNVHHLSKINACRQTDVKYEVGIKVVNQLIANGVRNTGTKLELPVVCSYRSIINIVREI